MFFYSYCSIRTLLIIFLVLCLYGKLWCVTGLVSMISISQNHYSYIIVHKDKNVNRTTVEQLTVISPEKKVLANNSSISLIHLKKNETKNESINRLPTQVNKTTGNVSKSLQHDNSKKNSEIKSKPETKTQNKKKVKEEPSKNVKKHINNANKTNKKSSLPNLRNTSIPKSSNRSKQASNVSTTLDKVYDLVLFTTEEVRELSLKINNTIYMMYIFQQNFNFKAIYFTSSPSIIKLCNSLNITVSSNLTLNPFNLPYIGSMYHTAHSLYSAKYYGYINADILISIKIFDVINYVESLRSSTIHDSLVELCNNAYNVREPHFTSQTNLIEYEAEYEKAKSNFYSKRGVSSVDMFILSPQFVKYKFGPMVIARARIDTYMMHYALYNNGFLIDVTDSVSALHQGRATYTSRANKQNSEDYNWNINHSKYFITLENAPYEIPALRITGYSLQRKRHIIKANPRKRRRRRNI